MDEVHSFSPPHRFLLGCADDLTKIQQLLCVHTIQHDGPATLEHQHRVSLHCLSHKLREDHSSSEVSDRKSTKISIRGSMQPTSNIMGTKEISSNLETPFFSNVISKPQTKKKSRCKNTAAHRKDGLRHCRHKFKG